MPRLCSRFLERVKGFFFFADKYKLGLLTADDDCACVLGRVLQLLANGRPVPPVCSTITGRGERACPCVLKPPSEAPGSE